MSTPPLVAALLVRNEMSRYLDRVLRHYLGYCDKVLVLDDHSDDGSPTHALALGCVVRHRSGIPMWGQESLPRRELWEWGAAEAGEGWLLIADADQEVTGDVRSLTQSWAVNSWAFKLYDLWDSEQTYRSDGFWQAHHTHRPWLFAPNRVPPGWVAQWNGRGVHTGHAPLNFPHSLGHAPDDITIRHLAYLDKDHRLAKLEQYRRLAPHLAPPELAHALSIGDP